MSQIGMCGVPHLILEHLISSVVRLAQLVSPSVARTIRGGPTYNIERTNPGAGWVGGMLVKVKSTSSPWPKTVVQQTPSFTHFQCKHA